MTESKWVTFNPVTQQYETKDGTKVPAELVDNAESLLDVIFIAAIREQQRQKPKP